MLCQQGSGTGVDEICTESALDALFDNRASHAFHPALGVAVTERVA
jgi:hypothetical protein